jgi:hypothetical protein
VVDTLDGDAGDPVGTPVETTCRGYPQLRDDRIRQICAIGKYPCFLGRMRNSPKMLTLWRVLRLGLPIFPLGLTRRLCAELQESLTGDGTRQCGSAIWIAHSELAVARS